MDSNFIRHEQCPSLKCRSSDAFAVYDDGHGWCFSCGFYQPARESLGIAEAKIRLQERYKQSQNSNAGVYLPFGVVDNLPDKVKNWLASYEITQNEIKENRLIWNPAKEDLIFPVFDGMDNLIAFQERHFGAFGKQFKTHGEVEKIFHYVGNNDERIVVVEDFVSAIKVGRQARVMPLLGSNLSMMRIVRLALEYSKLAIWLDWDKLKESIRFREMAQTYFEGDVHIIATPHDPKAYNDKEIESWLLG